MSAFENPLKECTITPSKWLGKAHMDKENRKYSVQTWVSASLILVFVGLVSKGLGFVREILVAKYFGASGQVDAFMVAISLPMVIGGGIGFAVSTALVPIYRKLVMNFGHIRANQLAVAAIILGTGISILLMLPLFMMPLPLIKLVAPSLPGSTARLAAELTRWLSLYVLTLNLTYMLTAVFHAVHHFKIPAFSDLFFNAIAIPVLISLALPFGIYALVLGNFLGMVLCVTILLVLLFKRQIFDFGVTFQSKDLKGILLLAVPILFYDFSCQIANVVENYFASGLPEGSIAALNYAKRLVVPIVAVIAISVARGVYPTLSTMYSEQKMNEARDLFVKLNKQLIVIFIPLTVMFILLREDIIRILFMRGAFDNTALRLASTALIFYAGGFLVAAIEPVFLRACYAFSDTVTPIASTILSVLFAILLSYYLTPLFGIAGIALVMNLSFLIRVLVQAISVRKKLGGLAIREILRTIALSLVSALLAYVPVSMLNNDHVLNLLFSVLLYMGLYFGVGWFIMNSEIKTMGRLLSQTFRASPLEP